MGRYKLLRKILNTYAHYINWDAIEPSYHMLVTVGAVRGLGHLRSIKMIKPQDDIVANFSRYAMLGTFLSVQKALLFPRTLNGTTPHREHNPKREHGLIPSRLDPTDQSFPRRCAALLLSPSLVVWKWRLAMLRYRPFWMRWLIPAVSVFGTVLHCGPSSFADP
jgi:hypothetical protein